MEADEADWVDDAGILVAFTVDMMEWHDGPMEFLCHNIKGEVFLLDDYGERESVGKVDAELFNVQELYWAGVMFDAYDSRSDQLTNAFERLYDLRTREFKRGPIKVAGGFEYIDPAWHLHISSLFIDRKWRRRKFGLRALRLLKLYARRPLLVVTAKSFPGEGEEERPNPTPKQIQRLAAYYQSDPTLAFQPLGPKGRGWLIANWSERSEFS